MDNFRKIKYKNMDVINPLYNKNKKDLTKKKKETKVMYTNKQLDQYNVSPIIKLSYNIMKLCSKMGGRSN